MFRIGGHGLALLLVCALAGCGNGSGPAADDSLTAIDIALEPDATMLARAGKANDRLRSIYPSGFALDEVHHPHITMLQRFVRTLISPRSTPPPTKFSPSRNRRPGGSTRSSTTTSHCPPTASPG